jgi:hypothetical protein
VRRMQVWIAVNPAGPVPKQDISFAYDPETTLNKGAPAEFGLTIGAESDNGASGAQVVGPPTASYVVTSAPGAGESKSFTVTVKAISRGQEQLTSIMFANTVPGATTVTTPIELSRR